MTKLTLFPLALALAAPAFAQDAYQPSQASLKAHVDFLASDAMRGREAGSPEYDIAAQYVATRFAELGLKPAGDDGSYIQKVPLVSAQSTGHGAIAVTRGGQQTALVFGEDYLPGQSLKAPRLSLNAPLVFVGFGVVAPAFKRDDYAGLDVKGKIVVLLSGAPKAIPGEERAHYGNGTTKAIEAEKHGAIGVITLETPTRAKVLPFARAAKTWDDKRMVWRQPDGSGFSAAPNAPGLAYVSLAGAEKLLAGIKGGAAAVMAAAETPQGRVKGAALGSTASVQLETAIKPAESSNVAGMIEGSDPALKSEVVVLSGHLDHVGICPEVKGDTICNGAMDNAVGIASMLEVARGFVQGGEKPRRSVLFLAVTAEEKGLVGADYFARHPTVAKDRLVADVNLDMPIITYAFEDVVAFGADHSSIGATVAKAAAPLGIGVSPDPAPDQAIFTRSDHYRFVQQGVPSVFIVTGSKGPGGEANAAFLKNNYHQPSDQPDLPFDWGAGARFVSLNLAIARELANAPERPRWNKGDFFGTLYNGFGAR
ncbi:M28 family metallopeptidase [Sphingomonas sanxanigenens]|uniref:Peptidase M28 domain-containing protein n=1 Tax=Sphingomonas sanxanigenens DSM 19645 = NX02 TaxID=1123269 RepID=W0AI58_9SPHN|nr:M28 family metallopeptidase [Sphingomonas sanxanigenens]AHE56806.1 hypothetical protein NX02_26020 [Sphingomonas sanxanigenens DSM 19645 = NX02]